MIDTAPVGLVTLPTQITPVAAVVSALLAFGGAVLGGLLLNIMPCVFPILSLKALGLARSGESERHARSEALAYTAGVVLVCLALGATLLALRAGGASAGWAFQLQDPRVVGVLLLLVVAIALNLAGLFELPTPQFAGRSGASGAFMTGALAAFVATPLKLRPQCAAPFEGEIEQLILIEANKRRNQQAGEVEIIARLHREGHRRQQVLDRQRLGEV